LLLPQGILVALGVWLVVANRHRDIGWFLVVAPPVSWAFFGVLALYRRGYFDS
jgi:hypothetical protein